MVYIEGNSDIFLEVPISQLNISTNNYRYYVDCQVGEKDGCIEVEVEEFLRRAMRGFIYPYY